MAIEWTQSLAVGNNEIDTQHKELFSRINRLVEAMNQRKGKEEVGETLKFLESYVVMHFGTEERHMARLNYPKAAAHKTLHEEFKKSFGAIKKKYDERGAGADIVIQIHRDLVNWLMTHIPVNDKELAGSLNSR